MHKNNSAPIGQLQEWRKRIRRRKRGQAKENYSAPLSVWCIRADMSIINSNVKELLKRGRVLDTQARFENLLAAAVEQIKHMATLKHSVNETHLLQRELAEQAELFQRSYKRLRQELLRVIKMARESGNQHLLKQWHDTWKSSIPTNVLQVPEAERIAQMADDL